MDARICAPANYGSTAYVPHASATPRNHTTSINIQYHIFVFGTSISTVFRINILIVYYGLDPSVVLFQMGEITQNLGNLLEVRPDGYYFVSCQFVK